MGRNRRRRRKPKPRPPLTGIEAYSVLDLEAYLAIFDLPPVLGLVLLTHRNWWQLSLSEPARN